MQYKMAGSPRWLQAFYRAYFAFWIPALAWAATWWPLGLMYWMARWLVIAPFALVRPKYMRAVCSNLSRILGLPPHHRQVRRTAWRMMWEHAYHWVDFFRYAPASAEKLRQQIAVLEGWERFTEARQGGRGVLLLTAHMGNPEVGAVTLGKHLGTVHVLYWRDRFAKAEEFRARLRQLGNVRGIPVDASPLSVVPALRVLRSGGVLACHGDRDFNDQGWLVPFFGKPTSFPPGPFYLAARGRALVIPTFFLLEPDRRFRVVYEKPMEVPEDTSPASLRPYLEQWVALLERYVQQYPQQWYCFYPFWGGHA
ncbi:MAG: lysophospholipid acyltransferase family protein [Thermoanaerobaculum sp.]|nr:lysophospholipid acyltransferase family protein [Thermoanaerobaculum sp.]